MPDLAKRRVGTFSTGMRQRIGIAAIVDRLTFGGNIIETGTQSYRLAQTLAQRTA